VSQRVFLARAPRAQARPRARFGAPTYDALLPKGAHRARRAWRNGQRGSPCTIPSVPPALRTRLTLAAASVGVVTRLDRSSRRSREPSAPGRLAPEPGTAKLPELHGFQRPRMAPRWVWGFGIMAAFVCEARDTAPGSTAESARLAASAPQAGGVVLCQDVKAPNAREVCLAVRALASGRAGELVRRFEPSLAQALPEARLVRAWAGSTRGMGQVEEIRTLATEQSRDRVHVQALVRFEHGAVQVDVVVASASRRFSTLGFGPAPRIWEPPAYADRGAFTEVSLTVGREPGLPALLTLPRAPRRVPGVVVVHGSGPSDEDCSAHPLGFGNKPCKDLAWGLASRGVAVLRYRKRSLVETEPFASLDEEVIRDVCAARSRLAARAEVDPKRVFLVGHSLGGALAPRIAKTCGELAGLVLLASPARRMDLVLTGQIAYLRWRAGNPELTAGQVNELRTLEQRINDPGADPDEEIAMLGSVAPRSYWRDLFSLDPAADARDLSLPMLVIQGERDYQVSLADFELWKGAVPHREQLVARRYPRLDHDLAPGSGLSSHYDYYEARHVDVAVLNDIAAFVAGVGSATRAAP
jgi:fermentation-respiration switch protein FrsA (DUF1100 family)